MPPVRPSHRLQSAPPGRRRLVPSPLYVTTTAIAGFAIPLFPTAVYGRPWMDARHRDDWPLPSTGRLFYAGDPAGLVLAAGALVPSCRSFGISALIVLSQPPLVGGRLQRRVENPPHSGRGIPFWHTPPWRELPSGELLGGDVCLYRRCSGNSTADTPHSRRSLPGGS